jgi:hypothetical protein
MPRSANLSGPFYTTYKEANGFFNAETFLCAEETVEELLKKATTPHSMRMSKQVSTLLRCPESKFVTALQTDCCTS